MNSNIFPKEIGRPLHHNESEYSNVEPLDFNRPQAQLFWIFVGQGMTYKQAENEVRTRFRRLKNAPPVGQGKGKQDTVPEQLRAWQQRVANYSKKHGVPLKEAMVALKGKK